MKKVLFAVAAAALVGTANAQSAFDGFYGQLGVGISSANPSLTDSYITNPSGTRYNYSTSVNTTNSFIGTITAGYNFSVSPTFLLGVGVDYLPFNSSSGDYTQTNSSLSPSTSNGTWKTKGSYNVFLSPGFLIDKEKLFYGKIGYTGTSVESTPSGGSSGSVNLSGYSLGLGYKQIVSKNWYAFGEGVYSSYGSKNQTGTGPWASGGTYSYNAKVGVNTMNFIVGVGYQF
jgi:opacity protein-like surface antigen